MAETTELASLLKARLKPRLPAKEAKKIFRSLEDDLFVPRGLYFSGDLHIATQPDLPAEIVGWITRADGSDLSERELRSVEAWLSASAAIAEFSLGPLEPSPCPAP